MEVLLFKLFLGQRRNQESSFPCFVGQKNQCFLSKTTCRPPVFLRTDLPLHRAPPCPESPVVCSGFGFDMPLITQQLLVALMTGLTIYKIPGHALHEKGLQRQISVGYIGLQPGMKSGCRPADKPLINRGLCSSNGLHRNSLVRASEEIPGHPWDEKGLQMFRTVVFDALEGTRDGCVLREQTCRRPILPGPPRPDAPLCAARPDPPVVCPDFGFDRCFSSVNMIFQACLELNMVTGTNRRRYIYQHLGTQCTHVLDDEPCIKQLSTASFVPLSVYIVFLVLPESSPGGYSVLSGEKKGCVFSFPASCAVHPRLSLSPRHGPPSTVPPMVCLGFVLDM